MKLYIQPSTISGKTTIPPSKSHTLRAILFALMGEGKTTIYNFLLSPDSFAMIEAVKLLGAKVKVQGTQLEIEGVGAHPSPAEDVIHAGNSGQILRFIGALAALIPTYSVITGDSSIRHNRPTTPLLSALSQLGAFAESSRQNGRAPILIKGPMCKGRTELDGRDSQPVSGLIISTAFAKHQTEIIVHNPGEKPWIDLTLHWLDFLGIKYHNHNYTRYILYGNGHYNGFNYSVPADLSSMAFPLAAALVTRSSITLKNVAIDDVQGDKKFLYALLAMGANISIERDSVHLEGGGRLQGKRFDINDYIDAMPILAVIGCFADGETELYNGAIAREKECDRISAICTELKKMGANIREEEGGITLFHSKLKGAYLKSYSDHRIAMSLAVAALGAKGESIIDGVECTQKTYPNFAMQMRKLGANIRVKP